MSAFRMYLRVASTQLQPEEITERLGVSPSDFKRIGSRSHPEMTEREHSTWIRNVGEPGSLGRPEDLEHIVLGWGWEFANALAALTDSSDAVVYLEIVQEIRDIDDPLQKGIFLSSQLMAWLGAAKAALDIDQYVYHECSQDG